jgi:hypothetical protein
MFFSDYRKWFKIEVNTENSISPKKWGSGVVRGDCLFFFGGTSEESNQLDYVCLGKDDFEEEFEVDGKKFQRNFYFCFRDAFKI